MGGDEFAVLLPTTGRVAAALVAERIRRATESIPLGRNLEVPVTVSVGVASTEDLPEPAEPAGLLSRADAAVYRAKAGGRNRVAAG
ncbi:MAG: GGDEF domain-containing protein [Holophagales bacterium]|nr:GGDEF domain-containing protein [Holophagales bacterium]